MRETRGKFALHGVATRVVGACFGDGGEKKKEKVRERGRGRAGGREGGKERVSGSRGAFS